MYRILIAEDDPVHRNMLARSIGRLGCRVETVDTCGKLRRMLRRARYALVLLDLALPDCDGIEAVEMIGRSRAFDPPPTIVISGICDVWAIQRARRAGARGYLIKTRFNTRQLLQEVERSLAWAPVAHAAG